MFYCCRQIEEYYCIYPESVFAKNYLLRVVKEHNWILLELT